MSSNTEEQNRNTSNTGININTDAELKQKILTCYINYNETDDLTQLFTILAEFRKKYGLKYSHQKNAQMVFFNIGSEHLDELSKVRPFRISKYQTRSEYRSECDDEFAEQLMKRKDSFIRLNWNKDTSVITFTSRTPPRVHLNLVRRIFRDSGLEFIKLNHTVLREYDENKSHLNQHSISFPLAQQHSPNQQNLSNPPNPQNSSNPPNPPNSSNSSFSPQEKFQKVERKTNKKVVKEPNNSHTTTYNSKQKIRGVRSQRSSV